MFSSNLDINSNSCKNYKLMEEIETKLTVKVCNTYMYISTEILML